LVIGVFATLARTDEPSAEIDWSKLMARSTARTAPETSAKRSAKRKDRTKTVDRTVEIHLTEAVKKNVADVQTLADFYATAGELARPERLAIVGFSQGACLTAEYVLQHPGCCGAAVIFTGAIIGAESPAFWRAQGPRLDGLRVLITGSDVDDWVSEDKVRETADVLGSLGADVTLRLYPGRPHVVTDEELVEAQTLLQEMRQRVTSHPHTT